MAALPATFLNIRTSSRFGDLLVAAAHLACPANDFEAYQPLGADATKVYHRRLHAFQAFFLHHDRKPVQVR
jgi:hypothetical protein